MKLTDEQRAEVSGRIVQALAAGHDLGEAPILGAFVLAAEVLDEDGRDRFVCLHFNGSDAHLLGMAHVLVSLLQPTPETFDQEP